MILFKKLKYRNFLSSGNNWTEIQLDRAKHTLIVGHNGAGKSTMLDALSFALFGKAHRNINKPQLVNSINKKGCEVEVEFQIGKNSYLVKRGISPGLFEIYVNGEMLNQSSHSKEYQRILEQNILKLNHKSFHQIVVLGSSSFIPFMQLPQGHRRSVIEDLLDINVFSKMNIIIKERNSILKDKIKEISHNLEINETKRDGQKKYISNLERLNKSHKKEKEDQISQLQADIDDLQVKNNELVSKISITKPDLEKDLKLNHDQKTTVLQQASQVSTEIKALVKEAKFYANNDACPTCKQKIDSETKDTATQTAKEKARILDDKRKTLAEQSTTIESKIADLEKTFKEINDLQQQVNAGISTITSNQKIISRIEKELSSLNNSSSDIKNAKEELEVLENEREEFVEEKFKMTDEFQYNSVMGEMLKDTGIKTKVIKQYLPVINKLVNQYLQVLDFFVSFELDEAFVEEIRSRHRDSFSYDSFSEGEKQRIDLALLFTWRQIAKMKNSVATNLLVLDETFDSSLDHDGVENLMKILYTITDDTNVFVISHKGEILEGKFEKKIEFHKEKNFSVMKG
jgi:DNA repair exonuclease SbcCD ATPase subunit